MSPAGVQVTYCLPKDLLEATFFCFLRERLRKGKEIQASVWGRVMLFICLFLGFYFFFCYCFSRRNKNSDSKPLLTSFSHWKPRCLREGLYSRELSFLSFQSSITKPPKARPIVKHLPAKEKARSENVSIRMGCLVWVSVQNFFGDHTSQQHCV